MKLRKLTRGRPRGPEWILDYYAGGKRVRRWFKSRAAAEAEQASLKDQKRTCGEAWVDLEPAERADLMAVHVEAAREGVTLRALLEAYRNRTLAPQTAIVRTLGRCVDETLQAKAGENLRPRYVRELGNYLNSFASGRTELPIDKITVAEIEQWFDDRGEAPATRRSNLGRLGSMFDLAWRRHYIADNPCLRVTVPKLEQTPPRILTPKEAGTLLATCGKRTPELLPWLALGLFAGIRPDELRRLTWGDVDTAQGLVTIDAATSKVRRRRIVPLKQSVEQIRGGKKVLVEYSPALDWLKVRQPGKPAAPIMPLGIREKRQRGRLVKASGIKWSHDLLRHSAASYLLALHGDAPKVANMLGHSTRTLETVYKNIVTPEACASFWALTPKNCKSNRKAKEGA